MSSFKPTERALEFGEHYTELLKAWGRFFEAAAAVSDANVRLGRFASDAANEFDQWTKAMMASPWGWMAPDVLQRFMTGAAGTHEDS